VVCDPHGNLNAAGPATVSASLVAFPEVEIKTYDGPQKSSGSMPVYVVLSLPEELSSMGYWDSPTRRTA